MEKIFWDTRADFKQGEVYTPINLQLKYHSQLPALGSSFLSIKSHFPPTDESCQESSAPAREEQTEMSGERYI